MERCFTMLKPGVLHRRIIGEVIHRLERKGLQLIGIKMTCIDAEKAAAHYAEHKGKHFYDTLLKYITSGPVIAMVWQGDNCIAMIRKLIGATDPLKADPGTIRGDYCANTQHNIIHASDTVKNAEREIGLFFDSKELFHWTDEHAPWL